MDPTVASAFSSAFAGMALRMAQDHNERTGRQSDGMQIDNRGISAGVYKAVTETDMGEIIANLNTASHAPTAQPFVTPNFITPAGTVVK